MKNTSRKIISAVSALLLALSMTGCTTGTSSVSLKAPPEPEIAITEVIEEIPEEAEEQKEETFGYISELSEYSSSEEIEYTDYRNNIVEEPVMSIFGNTFNGKRVTTANELYKLTFYATLRGDASMDVIIDGNFNPLSYDMVDYINGGDGYTWDDEENHYRYYFYYYPGERVVKALRNGTLSSLPASEKKLYEKAKQIVNTYTSPSNSDYQNAKILYDYLAKNVCYDWSLKNRTANGALFDGKTVCSGYADAYNLLLNLAGIESYLITGTAGKNGDIGGHAWNMAKINGKWVYFDATWDDHDFGNRMFYDYFAISESQMAKDHFWEREVTELLKKAS